MMLRKTHSNIVMDLGGEIANLKGQIDELRSSRDKFIKECEDLKLENEILITIRNEAEILRRKLKGERVCDNYCECCQHSYKIDETCSDSCRYQAYRKQDIEDVNYNKYNCLLDCKCSDFMLKKEKLDDCEPS